MNKTEALARLTQIEAEAKQLRAIIEAPEPTQEPSLLTRVEPGSGDTYWSLCTGTYGVDSYPNLSTVSRAAGSPQGSPACKTFNHFQSKELAASYADALETFLMLRHQPGTEPAEDGMEQWLISAGKSAHVDYFVSFYTKATHVSPCFRTREAAQQAIDTIGAERIMRMFKAFHHVEIGKELK